MASSPAVQVERLELRDHRLTDPIRVVERFHSFEQLTGEFSARYIDAFVESVDVTVNAARLQLREQLIEVGAVECRHQLLVVIALHRAVAGTLPTAAR